MAKAPPPSNRPKRAKAAHPSGVHKKVGSAHEKIVPGAGKIVVSRAGKTMAEVERMLGDIREKAGELSAGADRLLRRV